MCCVFLPTRCSPLFGLFKTVIRESPVSSRLHSYTVDIVIEYQTDKKFNCVFSLHLISVFCTVLFFSVFSPMDILAALFSSLAHKELPFLEYGVEFSQLAI